MFTFAFPVKSDTWDTLFVLPFSDGEKFRGAYVIYSSVFQWINSFIKSLISK